MMRGATIVNTRVNEVPMPAHSSLSPPAGSRWLRGQLTDPGDDNRLDSVFVPPGLFKTVRDDVARYSRIPVTRCALTRMENAYAGVIDSDGDPWLFALNSEGMRVRKASNPESAWALFDKLIDNERYVGRLVRREHASEETSKLYITMSKSEEMTLRKDMKPYGHIGYMKRTKTGVVYVKPKGVKAWKPSAAEVKKQQQAKLAAKVSAVSKLGGKEKMFIPATNPFSFKKDPVAYDLHDILRDKYTEFYSLTKKETLAVIAKYMDENDSGDVEGDTLAAFEYLASHDALAPHNGGDADSDEDGEMTYSDDISTHFDYVKHATRYKKIGLSDDECKYAVKTIKSWAGSSSAAYACHLRGVIARAAGMNEGEDAAALKAVDAWSGGSKSMYLAGYQGKEPPPKQVIVGAVSKMVKASQNAYKGKKTITLYRGVNEKQGKAVRDSKGTLAVGVLSSWSESENVAKSFGDMILKIEVPVEAVVFSHRTCSGLLSSEKEVIIAATGSIKSKTYYGNDGYKDDESGY